jgi:hypothetical protein
MLHVASCCAAASAVVCPGAACVDVLLLMAGFGFEEWYSSVVAVLLLVVLGVSVRLVLLYGRGGAQGSGAAPSPHASVASLSHFAAQQLFKFWFSQFERCLTLWSAASLRLLAAPQSWGCRSLSDRERRWISHMLRTLQAKRPTVPARSSSETGSSKPTGTTWRSSPTRPLWQSSPRLSRRP